MSEVAVTDDFKTTPFWWESAPLGPSSGSDSAAEVPARAGVAVIGAGLSGLSVALHLARGGYLGHKLAQRILSRPNRDTVFADRRYPQRFGYRGSTWFLPLVGRWYRALDRREAGLLR